MCFALEPRMITRKSGNWMKSDARLCEIGESKYWPGITKTI
jgi:hypothetical protein